MDVNITIIGAGVVGLAIAENLSGEFSDVFIIEKHNTFGQETSSRNSEVIHAGIYYTKDSLKARLCIEGKRFLYEFCRKYDIPFNKIGKLIVATSKEEVTVIELIRQTAILNGVNDLTILERNQIANLEPEIYALKAILSPSTGIIDTHSLMKQFETNTFNNGGQIVYGSEVTGIKRIKNGYKISLLDAYKKSFSYTSGIVINSAGLTSDKISEMAGMSNENLKIHFCKGEYFKINPPKNRLIKRLIYPVPHHNLEGIGIHATVDLSGGARLGPDVKFLETNVCDYTVTPSRQEAFFNAAKRYLPFLEYNDLTPEMAGIRPKIQKPGGQQRDFYITEESERGCPGFINLIGIESPGLTASIAIAKYVRNLISI